ncbi:hypothetical protein AB0J81_38125, partial [Streptomyces bobili]
MTEAAVVVAFPAAVPSALVAATAAAEVTAPVAAPPRVSSCVPRDLDAPEAPEPPDTPGAFDDLARPAAAEVA